MVSPAKGIARVSSNSFTISIKRSARYGEN
jgi:hypothetical protein